MVDVGVVANSAIPAQYSRHCGKQYAFHAYTGNQIDRVSSDYYGYVMIVDAHPDHRCSDVPCVRHSGLATSTGLNRAGSL